MEAKVLFERPEDLNLNMKARTILKKAFLSAARVHAWFFCASLHQSLKSGFKKTKRKIENSLKGFLQSVSETLIK